MIEQLQVLEMAFPVHSIPRRENFEPCLAAVDSTNDFLFEYLKAHLFRCLCLSWILKAGSDMYALFWSAVLDNGTTAVLVSLT